MARRPPKNSIGCSRPSRSLSPPMTRRALPPGSTIMTTASSQHPGCRVHLDQCRGRRNSARAAAQHACRSAFVTPPLATSTRVPFKSSLNIRSKCVAIAGIACRRALTSRFIGIPWRAACLGLSAHHLASPKNPLAPPSPIDVRRPRQGIAASTSGSVSGRGVDEVRVMKASRSLCGCYSRPGP